MKQLHFIFSNPPRPSGTPPYHPVRFASTPPINWRGISHAFLLFCSSALFAQQSDTTTLNLLAPTYPTEFTFTPKGYWTQTYNDVDYIFFKSQIYSLSHQIEGPGSAVYQWHGFTVCNSGDNANHSGQWYGNDYQWGCMAGGGIKTDAQGNILKDANGDVLIEKGIPYLVAYWYNMIEPEYWHWGVGGIFLDEPTRCLQIRLDNDKEYEAVGVYVNIHPWSYYVNLTGEGTPRPLNQEGDYFKVIFHSFNPDGSESGNSVEHILAKFENGQLKQSTKWEWIDLSSLGKIGGIYCTMASTVGNGYGPLTPVYFCMDKLQVRTKETVIHIPVTNIVNVPTVAAVGEPLTLTGTVIPTNATCQNIIWNIKDSGTTEATISENVFLATDTGTVVITATIKDGLDMGSDFIKDFTVNVLPEVIKIDENDLAKIQIYSHHNSVYVKNQPVNKNYFVNIFDMTGRLVYQGVIQNTETVIPLNVVSGVYNVLLYCFDVPFYYKTKIFINTP